MSKSPCFNPGHSFAKIDKYSILTGLAEFRNVLQWAWNNERIVNGFWYFWISSDVRRSLVNSSGYGTITANSCLYLLPHLHLPIFRLGRIFSQLVTRRFRGFLSPHNFLSIAMQEVELKCPHNFLRRRSNVSVRTIFLRRRSNFSVCTIFYEEQVELTFSRHLLKKETGH